MSIRVLDNKVGPHPTFSSLTEMQNRLWLPFDIENPPPGVTVEQLLEQAGYDIGSDEGRAILAKLTFGEWIDPYPLSHGKPFGRFVSPSVLRAQCTVNSSLAPPYRDFLDIELITKAVNIGRGVAVDQVRKRICWLVCTAAPGIFPDALVMAAAKEL